MALQAEVEELRQLQLRLQQTHARFHEEVVVARRLQQECREVRQYLSEL